MLLTRGQNNTNVPLTLAEKTTLTGTFYYLFVFQNDYTKVKYYQIFTDVSTAGAARQRSNLFNIEVITSGSASANQILLGNIGLYTYTIYAQSSSSNLDPDSADEFVEQGVMRLIDSEDSIYVQYDFDVTYVAHEQ